MSLLFLSASLPCAAAPLPPPFPAEPIAGLPFPYRHLVDAVSQRYRTGQPDPAVAAVPDEVERGMRTDPERAIPLLARFLLSDGGAHGPARDEYAYVKRIHDWITAHVAYDNFLLAGVSGYMGSRSPRQFLTFDTGPRTTCGGYSRLFQSLAEAGGVECRYIPGLTRSYIAGDGEIGDHAWNAVRINGRWYIVDTTADARMEQDGNQRSPLDDYSDAWLFIAPEAALVRNFAEEPADQLIARPISRDEFESMPRLHPRFLQYGLRPVADGTFAERTERRDRRPNSRWYDREDLYPFDSDGERSFIFDAPSTVYVSAALYDESEGRIPGRAFVSSEPRSDGRFRVEVRFSSPGGGSWRGVIRARDLRRDELSWSVYAFYLRSDGARGALLPPTDSIVIRAAPSIRSKSESF